MSKKTSAKINAIRGMNDILPEQAAVWRFLENTCQQLFDSYGYREVRLPIVEFTDLFKRTIGEVTDIVEKEMYTFKDRNDESLTLRPEGTAGCVRAGEQHGLFFNQIQRLWYSGPMFRYEKPQKGRYRQFHQIGVEAFGMNGPDVDAELIIMTARLWQMLGLSDRVELQLNSLGDIESRSRFKDDLVTFLTAHKDQLDEDSQRRLETNPLRVLDSKNAGVQRLLITAPDLISYLDEESLEHFTGLKARLDAVGISYVVNSRLVRGLDYYSKTVFEWVTSDLGAQGTVCAGGRYDGLVEQLGGRATPAVGFAMGVERLALLMEQAELNTESQLHVDVYLAALGAEAELKALALSEGLRDALPELKLVSHCGGGSFKSQLKKADKSGAQVALIIGEDEVRESSVVVKYLRKDVPQETVKLDNIIDRIKAVVAN